MNKSFIVFAGLISMLMLFVTGCIKQKVLVKVKPDGTGNIVVSAMFDKKVVESFNKTMEVQKEKMAASGMDTGSMGDFDPFYNEDLLKRQADNFGENITFVKAKKIKNKTGRGYIAIYAFKNIEDVKINLGKASNPMPSMGPNTSSDKDTINFKFKKDKFSTLTVNIPQADKELKVEEAELLKGDKEKIKPTLLTAEEKAQMMSQGAMFGLTGKETTKEEIIKKMFNGLSVKIELQVDGKLIKSDATYQSKKNKNRCTLYSMDFGKLLQSDVICSKLSSDKMQGGEIMKKISKMDSLEGVTLEKKKEITLEFESK